MRVQGNPLWARVVKESIKPGFSSNSFGSSALTGGTYFKNLPDDERLDDPGR